MFNRSKSKIRRIGRRIRFHLSAPFVRTGFRIREKIRRHKVNPIVFLNQIDLIQKDLSYYEQEDGGRPLDYKFADDINATKKDIIKENRSYMTIYTILSIFLYTQMYSLQLKISIMGIELQNITGAIEISVLVLSIIGLVTATKQLHINILDGYLIYIVNNKLEPELKNYYDIKYISGTIKLNYIQFNTPHISGFNYFYIFYGAMYSIIIISIILFSTFSMFLNFLIFKYALANGDFGLISTAVAIVFLIQMIYLVFCAVSFYIKIPFVDYSSLHYFQIATQMHPERESEFRDKVWGKVTEESIKDRRLLEKKGYFKKKR